MTYEKSLQRVKEISTELSYIRAINALFMWDQWMGLPKEGNEYRQKLQGYVVGKSSEILNSSETKELAKYFSKIDLDTIENDIDKAVIRTFLHKFNYSVNVPVEKNKRLAELSLEAQNAWIKALNEKNYSIFKPYLKELFELRLEISKYIDPNRPPFEVMMDESGEGICLEEVNREFSKLREAIIELVPKITKSTVEIDDSFLKQSFDKDELISFVKFIVEKMGYDINKGAYGEVIHPFTNMFGPKDVRITLNCKSYKFGVFAAIHEAGHAMYGFRGNKEVDEAQLWGGIMGGFHEGQSRFHENIIGKSKEFWQYFYPEAQKRFKQFENVSFDDYYNAINKVQPSLSRILADEVTYSLHPIIRFELEQELIDGKINFDELPQAWNDKYYEYLGIRPENDAEGVLQDIHWSAGMVGYFQSYTLGNIYGGQIRNTLLKAVPNVYDEIAKGNFDPFNNWMTENIHQYGECYTASEIIKRISGESLNADYFIDYLNEKYNSIYKLK